MASTRCWPPYAPEWHTRTSTPLSHPAARSAGRFALPGTKTKTEIEEEFQVSTSDDLSRYVGRPILEEAESMLMLTKWCRAAAAGAAAGVLLIAAAASEARVTHITISSTTSAFNGRVFGNARAYDQIRGTATGELNPLDSRNEVITDIHLAPRNANGKVAYTATFTLLKPVDMSRASGAMVYEVNNRGNHILQAAGFFNVGVSPSNPAGDGFL